MGFAPSLEPLPGLLCPVPPSLPVRGVPPPVEDEPPPEDPAPEEFESVESVEFVGDDAPPFFTVAEFAWG